MNIIRRYFVKMSNHPTIFVKNLTIITYLVTNTVMNAFKISV